jgi:aconitate hydratase
LKKQGVLALTFADPADYDKVQEADRVSILGLSELAPGKPVRACLKHSKSRAHTSDTPIAGAGTVSKGAASKTVVNDKDSTSEEILLHHTMTVEQIEWFKAGSALNLIRRWQG